MGTQNNRVFFGLIEHCMKLNCRNNWLILLLVIFLSACGNPNLDENGDPLSDNNDTVSDTDTGATTTTTTTKTGYAIRLSLVKALDNQATSSISSTSPGKLIATITDDNGKPINEVLITFSSDFALFSPASATALTDINGQANILLLPGEQDGAGTVNASFVYQDEELSSSLNFTVASAGATSSNTLNVTMTDANATATTVIRADAPGLVTATLIDSSGVGVSGVVVKVQGTLATFSPENGTVVTNNNGVATVQILAGDKTGADTLSITATTTGEILSSSLVFQVNPPALQFGNGTAGSFTKEVLGISSSTLAASATASITVDILNEDGMPFNTPVDVVFTSNCVTAGTSAIDAKVTTINGQAVATYEAKGCEGSDLITATATYSGTKFTATGLITIAAESAGFIEFISASPNVIAISGTGGSGLSETSIVTFRVRSSLGTPLANQVVDFSLNTTVGGISITPSSKTTNAEGEVTTTVKSGSVGSTVRVTGTVNNTNISAQSDQLIVSTGLPDQDSLSLAFSTRNPEAFSWDGEIVTITARLADRFNNPVPDGTAVYFTTEGGSIEPGCITSEGACEVNWTSQTPRPVDHRATVMAVAIGAETFFDEDGDGLFSDNDGEPFFDQGNGFFDEPFIDDNANDIFDEPFEDTNTDNTYDFGESFVDYNRNGRYDGAGTNPAGELTYTDSNGNGRYDGAGITTAGDSFTDVNSDTNFNAPGFSDLPEAYLDANENAQRDNGEPYLDFNNNGQYDNRDGQFNGALCSHTSICSSDRSIHVRKSKVIVMAGSFAYIVVQDRTTGDIYASNHPSVAAPANLDVSGGNNARLQITVMDHAGQVMPENTTITISSDVGEMVGELEYTVTQGTQSGGHVLNATISDDDAATGENGFITIEVATPKAIITTINIDLSV